MVRNLTVSLSCLALIACDYADQSSAPPDPENSDVAASEVSDRPSPSTLETLAGLTDDKRAEEAPLVSAIPARFHGSYAENLDRCDEPSHGLFTIEGSRIRFFESTGEVRNVRADGAYAAATVFEQYGDGPGATYAFYMRLMPDGNLRYRYDDNERQTWVRCP